MKTRKQILLVIFSAVLVCGTVGIAQQDEKLVPATTDKATDSAAPAAEAKPGDQQEAPQGEQQKKSPFGDNMFLFVMLGGLVLIFILSGRSKRKQEAKRKEMLSNLQKGAKITSIGGIIGNVIEVRDDEVLVKVDENVRIRLARWAIRGVGEESKQEDQTGKK